MCPPLPSAVITGFFGTMSESDSSCAFSRTLDEMLLVCGIPLFQERKRSPRYAVNNNLMLATL